MPRPFFEADRESNRPSWETEDNWRSEEFWQDLMPVADWRVVLEQQRVRALEESSSRIPPPGGGSSSVPTQDVQDGGVGRPVESTDCRSLTSGARRGSHGLAGLSPSEESR